MAGTRVLFVDDEPGMRLTLPAILKMHSFEVQSAGSVAEALQHINSSQFDVLVADLNIGEPGDGFTVVSAMRRTQPNCVNIILTGYPAFESALEAIRSQVDDYLVKPCEAETLVAAIERRLTSPQPQHRLPAKRFHTFLRDNIEVIVHRTLQAMKKHRKLGALPLSDEQRIRHTREFLLSIASSLEKQDESGLGEKALAFASAHGRLRRSQGYTLPMIVDDTRLLDQTVYELVQESLLELDLSYLIIDLRRFNDNLEQTLQEALNAFIEEKAA